jgi:DNA-binding transcriptional LysR family regulator
MHAAVLRYLDIVAREGSIRKAAAALHIASSAVNRQILNLEEELGVALFERRRDGVRPTPAGELLLRHVRSTLFDFDRIRAGIDDMRGLKTGEIKIAALDSLVVDFLPRVIAEFHGNYPGINYRVAVLGPTDVTEEVAAGRADIGVSFALREHREVATVAAVEAGMGALMAPNHPLADRRALRLVDCAPYPLILNHDTLPLAPLVEALLATGGTPVIPKLVSNSLEMMKRAIIANLGVGFFTRLAFRREIADGGLVHIPLAEASLERLKLAVVISKSRKLSVVTAMMLEHLVHRFEELAAVNDFGAARAQIDGKNATTPTAVSQR